MKSKWFNEKEELERLINVEKVSYEEIGRRYGCSGANIKKVAKMIGINLPIRSKNAGRDPVNKGTKKKYYCLNCGKLLEGRNKKYCNNKCQQEYEYKEWVNRWKSGKETGIVGKYGISQHLKRYLLEKYNYKCFICGWSEKNKYTNTIPLEVEHIDGNYLNNNEENLTILCPNCHSLTSTYKGANRGSGRKERSKYYLEGHLGTEVDCT